MKIVAMIPARMGSQRLKKKNLQKLNNVPLITIAIRKSIASGVFSQIWVNSEHRDFEKISRAEGVNFHRRPEHLASNSATSEQFVYEFLHHHPCDFLVQVHSIAPLLSSETVSCFVNELKKNQYDILLSVVNEQIECVYEGKPVNFSFLEKTNSQQLKPVQRITWGLAAWRRETYMRAYEAGQCTTYTGRIGFFPVDRFAGHIIKTKEDFKIAQALINRI